MIGNRVYNRNDKIWAITITRNIKCKKIKYNLRDILKGRCTMGNCQRLVFSLGVSQHRHKITNLWKLDLHWSSKLRENDERKNTLVGRICVLPERNKRLLPLSQKTTLLQRESFPIMFYTTNSSPMPVTKSVFK